MSNIDGSENFMDNLKIGKLHAQISVFHDTIQADQKFSGKLP